MFTKAFWKATAERAVSTAAQSAVLVLGAGQLVNGFEADWGMVAGFALGGAALSVLKGLAASAVRNDGAPSFTKAEVLVDPNGGYTSGHKVVGESE